MSLCLHRRRSLSQKCGMINTVTARLHDTPLEDEKCSLRIWEVPIQTIKRHQKGIITTQDFKVHLKMCRKDIQPMQLYLWHLRSYKRCNISEIVSDAVFRMTDESSSHWALNWAFGQMTQPIAHCIFVSSVKKATTPQQVTPQACCDIWHWNSAPLSARAT